MDDTLPFHSTSLRIVYRYFLDRWFDYKYGSPPARVVRSESDGFFRKSSDSASQDFFCSFGITDICIQYSSFFHTILTSTNVQECEALITTTPILPDLIFNFGNTRIHTIYVSNPLAFVISSRCHGEAMRSPLHYLP